MSSNNFESDFETDDELEFSFETPEESDFETDDELEFSFETPEESEFETTSDEELELERSYGERLYELSLSSFESELELDEELGYILNEMERDFFFKKAKKLWKKAKKGIKKIAKSKLGKVIKGIAAPALSIAKKIPGVGTAIEAATSLVRGDLKGALGSLAKSGLLKAGLSMIPGVGAILPFLEPALKAAGVELEISDTDEGRRQFANDVAYVSRESFDYVAKNLFDPKDQTNFANPLQAKKLADKALNYALRRAKAAGRPSFARRMGKIATSTDEQVISLQKGQVIKIVGM